MSTKEKILHAAKELFNFKGVENVTTRHIASQINISQGNLHYHYPNKNEIIIELHKQFLGEVMQRMSMVASTEFNLEMWYNLVSSAFRVMYDYRFFFIDTLVIWRKIEMIKHSSLAFYEQSKFQFSFLISQLNERGLLRNDISAEQFNNLYKHVAIFYNSWLSMVDVIANEEDPERIPQYFANLIFTIWVPYLSDKGLEDFKKITLK